MSCPEGSDLSPQLCLLCLRSTLRSTHKHPSYIALSEKEEEDLPLEINAVSFPPPVNKRCLFIYFKAIKHGSACNDAQPITGNLTMTFIVRLLF